MLLERHRGFASPNWHQRCLYDTSALSLSIKPYPSFLRSGVTPEEQKSNPVSSCRHCTLPETSTADSCSCSSQLGQQLLAPTHQPCGSGVLRKERISEDFNAGLGCTKFSLLFLLSAQLMEAGGLSMGYSPLWWPRPLLDLWLL